VGDGSRPAPQPAVTTLLYSAAASEDVLAACHWLEEVQPGLGERMLDELDRLASLVRQNPEMYELFSGTQSFGACRRAVLRTFDYALVYRVLPEAIEVLGLLHCRLDPVAAASRIGATG